jgi:hypothetical protein
MEKFTKVIKKEDKKIDEKNNVLFKNSTMSITESNDTITIEEKDKVVCIPYLTDYNQIILKQVKNETYKSIDGKEDYISMLETYIDDKYDMKWNLMKMLETRVGIVIRDKYPFEFEKPLFESKNNTKKVNFIIIPLTESDYHQVLLSNDLTNEKIIKLDAKYLNSIKVDDMETEIMISKMKKFLNM